MIDDRWLINLFVLYLVDARTVKLAAQPARNTFQTSDNLSPETEPMFDIGLPLGEQIQQIPVALRSLPPYLNASSPRNAFLALERFLFRTFSLSNVLSFERSLSLERSRLWTVERSRVRTVEPSSFRTVKPSGIQTVETLEQVPSAVVVVVGAHRIVLITLTTVAATVVANKQTKRRA